VIAPLRIVEDRMRAYYDRRAAEYDDWWTGGGLFAERDRPGWHEEVDGLVAAIRALPPARTLDVACGTAFLTRHLRGDVVALDQSESMVRIAAARLPHGRAVRGDAVPLPFGDGAFDRVFTGHFYGHLLASEREAFLAEARRVAPRLVVVDSALHEGVEPEEWQERKLNDGSRHAVYKRYFTPAGLAAELGGGDLLYAGRWFVAVSSTNDATTSPGG
jgi:demethylmenaquinone methyltransferase/2-methoxy-6-polyprenyl-1,4-benzoquinol methylase